MKKLLIMTGVAAFAFGAFAFSNGTGFEEPGELFPGTYWNNPSNLEASVTSYADSGETAYSTRPAYFVDKNVSQSNFLAIASASASDPLKRFVETTEEAKAIGNGLYLDTLVKFTAVSADSTETMGTSDTAAKLAIWAQETPAGTNFVVQAGYVTSNNVTSTNYVMTAPTNNFDFSAWHRLTVKAISDIGGDHAGFVVFVNGTALEREDGAVIADKGALTLNTVAGKFENAVLPSRRSSNWDDYQTLQAVSFSGTGGIDDVSFTDVAPDFAASDVIFTLNVGAGIKGFKLNGTSYSDSDFTDGFVTLKLNPGVTIVTVGDVTYADGYKNAALSGEKDGSIDELVFTVTGNAPEATISAVCDMFTITADGKTVGYATLADAIKDAENGTIVMADNYTIEGAYVSVTGNVVLDLAGNTLTGPENDALFTVKSGASLTIINSAVADGCLSVNYEEGTETSEKIVVNNKGTLVIGDTSGGFVTVDGFIANAVTKVYKGKFDAESNSNGDACAIPSASMDGVVPVKEGDYWVVNAGGEVKYTVTFVDYDGTGIASGDVKKGVMPTAPEENPTRTGYTFTGWEPAIVAVTSNTTYTATYSINTYTVTFDVDGDTTMIPAQNVNYGNTATEPTAPTKDNYTFAGWTLAGQTYDFAAQVMDDITLVATWTAVVPPTPSVDPVNPANGGTAEFKDADAATAAADAINADKAKYIAAPEGIANTYYDNVKAKADGNKVSVVFTADGEAAAKTSADAEVDELDKVLSAAAAGATAASITGAVPGFFYSVVYGTALTGEGAFATEGDRAQANKDGNVTIPVPCAGEGAGFYKVKVSPTK